MKKICVIAALSIFVLAGVSAVGKKESAAGAAGYHRTE